MLTDKDVGELWSLHYHACQDQTKCNECRLIRKLVEERAKVRFGNAGRTIGLSLLRGQKSSR